MVTLKPKPRRGLKLLRIWGTDRMIWISAGLAALAFVALWCFAVMPRRNHRSFETLKKYRYAHRGLHNIRNGVPENSLSAFRMAAEKGYGAELDVHLTCDGKLAVMHDSNLKRMCGGNADIETLTSSELEAYRLAGTEERIPYLKQVLEIFENRTPLIIELKTYRNNYAALTEAVCRELEDYSGCYCLESFDFRVLIWLKKHRPQIMRGQLAGFIKRHGGKVNAVLDFGCRNMLTNFLTRPDFAAYNYQDRYGLSISMCRKFWHVQEVSWTITDLQQLTEIEKDGAIAIFEKFEP